MIGAIPNPKKSFQIDKTANEVQVALENLPLFTKKYRLSKANTLLKMYTFDAYETLSLGVFIDVTYAKVSDSTTEVTIEVRRKIGSFDKSFEVTNANNHIVTLTDLIATSLTTDATDLKAEYEAKSALTQERLAAFKQKEADEKANRPLTYYTKQFFSLLIIGLILYGVYWIIMKMLGH